MVANKVTDLIGNTPVLKLQMRNNDWNIYLKLEKFNPGGSMKDRMAFNMITAAEKEGKLKPGGAIIESSSGNTAIGLAIIAAIKGYKFIAVVDHHASKEKIDMIKAYGGEIVVVGDGYKDNEVAVIEREKTAKKMSEDMPNSFFPNQADNFNNRNAYIDTLAKELTDELGIVNEFYGAIGTGGSVCGTALGLKKYNSSTNINAIEPEGSIIFGGPGKPYFQSGTGNPINAPIPKIIDYNLIHKNFYVTDKEAFNTCRYMAKNYGLLIGGSSGGVLYKALEDLNKKDGAGNAVILICDGGEKYLNNIFNDDWISKNNLIDDSIGNNIKNWIKEVDSK
jgi:cystathionine beta-synthase